MHWDLCGLPEDASLSARNVIALANSTFAEAWIARRFSIRSTGGVIGVPLSRRRHSRAISLASARLIVFSEPKPISRALPRKRFRKTQLHPRRFGDLEPEAAAVAVQTAAGWQSARSAPTGRGSIRRSPAYTPGGRTVPGVAGRGNDQLRRRSSRRQSRQFRLLSRLTW